jgi:glycosyltransferase involved in cell wall biosynthesis
MSSAEPACSSKYQTQGLVSVIIPNYNHAHFLDDALHSVLSQDYRNFEIIVVDDGSTDDSLGVLAKYGTTIRLIRQENKGLSGARNTGIRTAKGVYYCFLDADDYWLPNFLSTVVSFLDNHPEIGAVHTGFYFVDRFGERCPQINTITIDEDQLYDRLLDGEFFVPASVLIRRECFDRVGLFDETLRASEDWDIWLRVSRVYRFAGISEPLLNYRIHGNNMSADPEYMLKYQLMVAKKHFGAPDEPPGYWPIERKRVYAAIYRYAAQGYFFRGDSEKAQNYLQLTLETNSSLLESVDMFYDLGCADQPLGWRGDFVNVNLEKNAKLIISSLNKIFDNPSVSPGLRSKKKLAFAHAYLALGLLAYGSDRLSLARAYLLRALIFDYQLIRQRRTWHTLIKTIIGRRIIRSLKTRFAQSDTY